MCEYLKFWLRWHWNALRYKLGLTLLSPTGHEFMRMMKSNGWVAEHKVSTQNIRRVK